MEFGICDENSGGTGVAGIVEKVPSSADTDSMCFFFIGADGGDKIGVCCFSSGGDH